MRLNLPSLPAIRARWWAIAYLLLIPCCALVYDLLPRLDRSQFHFYHASSQYEKALYDDAANVIGQLQTVLTQNFIKNYSADFTQVTGWNIPIRDLTITGLRPREDSVEIHFRLRVQKETSAGPIVSYKPFQATIPIVGQDIVDPSSGIIYKPILFESDQLTIYNGERINFAAIFVSPNQRSLAPVLALPQTVNDRLKGFWRAARGFPTDSSGGFWRMLYFSVITITTIGYGDIYPISTVARLVVAFEAILGVVLVGLFLNAIVQKRNN